VARLAAYHAGEISFAELDASIQGWIAHVGHADSWGLRRHLLDTLVIRPAEHRRRRGSADAAWQKKIEAALARRLPVVSTQ
jgi:hypothetical protein